jgi:seryl-tRNA synthetase
MLRLPAFCIVLLLFGLVAQPLLAQNSSRDARREQRRERQEWKRTARQYVRNPLALRDQTRQQQAQTQQLTQRATQAEAQAQQNAQALAANEEALRAAKAERERLQAELQRQQEQAAHQSNSGTGGSGTAPAMPSGIVFRVQIGAYERFDLRRYDLADENWHTAQNNQLKCYQIGYFAKLQNANAFCADIRRLGIRDAFVVAYKDGQRLPVQEAARIAGQR